MGELCHFKVMMGVMFSIMKKKKKKENRKLLDGVRRMFNNDLK